MNQRITSTRFSSHWNEELPSSDELFPEFRMPIDRNFLPEQNAGLVAYSEPFRNER
ncbi:hypothetical protein S1OALGB6SA_1347 [Olavius algarvensis spirochete endosymbiont]|nr:hypothetical protein S1OALGB6SA_1347 [Olavius algarvensis spirochete endosymbiont]